MDGDLQDNPMDILNMIPYLSEYVMVTGWRKISSRFTMRFVVRWIASEKRKESFINVSFQAFGFTVYIRNLQLIFKKKLLVNELPAS